MAKNKRNTNQKPAGVSKPLKKPPEKSFQTLISNKYFFPVVIFLLCLLLYGNTIYNEYAIDDSIYTTNKFIINGFSDFKDIFNKGSLYGYDGDNATQYRPLVLLNFMVETAIFGFNPHVSHFINILLFGCTAVLLYFFLQKILENYNHAIIVASTLLFAFHPIHTEVVANIKSRDEILGLFFGLISFYNIIVYREKNKYQYYVYSLVAFFAAIFCKENCLTFVLVIPLILYFFSSVKIKNIVLVTLPYIGLSGVYLCIRFLVMHHLTFSEPIPVMNNTLMSAGNGADKIASSFNILGKYIYMTIIPYPLSWDYSYDQIPIVSWANIKPILSLLVCIFLAVVAVAGVKRKSIYSFLIAIFFITLFLSSNFIVKIASTFGERFLYVPSISFCIMLPIVISRSFKLNPTQKDWRNKWIFYIPLSCLLIVYALIVIPRNAEWKNNFTIGISGVRTSPNSGRTHFALATTYRDLAQSITDTVQKSQFYSLANKEFRKAAEIFHMDAEVFYNMGECYNRQGMQDSAIAAYKTAIELNPRHSRALCNLGVVYNNKEQYDVALTYLLRAYNVDSNNLPALINIGSSYTGEKKYALAFHYDSLLLKKDPANKPTLANLAALHDRIGSEYYSNNEFSQALKEFELALNLDTLTYTNYENVGVVYLKMNNTEQAKIYFQKALKMDPGNEALKKELQILDAGNK